MAVYKILHARRSARFQGGLLASAPTHHRLIVDLDNLVADIDLAAPMARALKLDSANNVYSGVGRVDLHAL